MSDQEKRMTSQAVAQKMGIPEAIERFWGVHKYSPTVRELSVIVGKSVGWTHAALLRLQSNGAVTWTPGMQRTLRVVR